MLVSFSVISVNCEPFLINEATPPPHVYRGLNFFCHNYIPPINELVCGSSPINASSYNNIIIWHCKCGFTFRR